jgi:hypothetical protein
MNAFKIFRSSLWLRVFQGPSLQMVTGFGDLRVVTQFLANNGTKQSRVTSEEPVLAATCAPLPDLLPPILRLMRSPNFGGSSNSRGTGNSSTWWWVAACRRACQKGNPLLPPRVCAEGFEDQHFHFLFLQREKRSSFSPNPRGSTEHTG